MSIYAANKNLDPVLDQKRRPSFVDGPSARFQESGVALQFLLQQTQTYPLWCDLHPGHILISGRMGLVPLRPVLI